MILNSLFENLKQPLSEGQGYVCCTIHPLSTEQFGHSLFKALMPPIFILSSFAAST